ncbi:MAG: SMC-Scp complex subunit ScpB [Verrucomicrobiota bacterium JB023]|nr:SMC-Scp complex subunit ScpB [Verrucomicrobiota bacterium JB023]
MELSAVIEALLVASDDPLPTSELARLVRARVAELEDEIAAEAADASEDTSDYSPAESMQAFDEIKHLADVNEDQIIAAMADLNQQYEEAGRSFLALERAKGWKIHTTPSYAGFVRHLFPGRKPKRLSAPAMETLAIIAYRQPVTKAAIDAVRGVASEGMLQKLLDLDLVKIAGRAELPGRPLLYETTDYFYEHFGIRSPDDLPNASELRTIKLPEPEDESGKEADEEADTPPAEEEKQMPLAEAPADPPEPEEEPTEDFALPEEQSPSTDSE